MATTEVAVWAIARFLLRCAGTNWLMFEAIWSLLGPAIPTLEKDIPTMLFLLSL